MDIARAPLQSIRRNLLGGALAIAIVGGGVALWACLVEIAGAVIAPGALVVSGSVKKVQHPVGGVIEGLFARNGDKVQAGALLVRLDATTIRAQLAVIDQSLDEGAIRAARLEAERDGVDRLRVPDRLAARGRDGATAELIAGEEKLLSLRQAARAGQRAQFIERVLQLQEEIRGQAAQAEIKTREIALIRRELDVIRGLHDKNLAPLARLIALEREATHIEGDLAQYTAGIARARARIAETELQKIQIDQDLRSEVAKELREIQAKTAELLERKVAVADQVKRTEIRAPVGGVVHQLSAHTVGGVVVPADTIMVIVPSADALAVETRISPSDIDQIHLAQTSVIRFPSLNQGNTPEIEGAVTYISADIDTDSRTGASYYTVRIRIDEKQSDRLGSVTLIPGMPVEAFIQLPPRTVATYLLKPVRDQIQRAFREK